MNGLSKQGFKTFQPGNGQFSGGFSLFELVVFIICVAIIYASAANRFAEFPGQAERANFLAVTTQLQTTVNLEMMLAAGAKRGDAIRLLAGANPMDLLQETPSNYLGAFGAVDKSQLPRRTWYFDSRSGELVYLANDPDGLITHVNGNALAIDEVRFRIVARYIEEDSLTGLPLAIAERDGNEIPAERKRTRFSGMALEATTPYTWGEADPEALIAAASAEING